MAAAIALDEIKSSPTDGGSTADPKQNAVVGGFDQASTYGQVSADAIGSACVRTVRDQGGATDAQAGGGCLVYVQRVQSECGGMRNKEST